MHESKNISKGAKEEVKQKITVFMEMFGGND
jgi:hypothetical protein